MAKIETTATVTATVLRLDGEETSALLALLNKVRGTAMRAPAPLGRIATLVKATGADTSRFDVSMGNDGKLIVND